MAREYLKSIEPPTSDEIRKDTKQSRQVIDAVWKELAPAHGELAILVAKQGVDTEFVLETATKEITYGSSDSSRKEQARTRILATLGTVSRPKFKEVDGKPVLMAHPLLDYVRRELRVDLRRRKEG